MKYIVTVTLIIIAVIVIMLQFGNVGMETAEPIKVDSGFTAKPDTALANQLEKFDSLKPTIDETVKKLKEYEVLKAELENREYTLLAAAVRVDTSEISSLRKQLNNANAEIFRLRNEVAAYKRTPGIIPQPEKEFIQPALETPDENSIVISFDGRSRTGDAIHSQGLIVYLIPYSRKVKQYMQYETSCDEKLYGNKQAKYYNGLYYFNNIKSGKYLIKVCTYYGNFRLIDKPSGKYNITMQIAPPIQ